MKIQIGNIVMNRTFRYLRPVMREYGPDFLMYYEMMFKVAIGIGDIIIVGSNIKFEKHLFFLVNTRRSRKSFIEALQWIRGHESYEDDYAFDQIHYGFLHMVVLRIPEKYYRTLYHFKMSRYSKMYTEQDIKKWFENREEYKVLTKNKEYRIEFVRSINERFDSQIEAKDFTGELDFPISEEDEFFNFIHRLTSGQYEPDNTENETAAGD
jgi:hypothetical protein